METTTSGYPVQLTYPESNKVANWRPLAHWLMVIPHYIINYVLTIVAEVILVISWLIIVFTGKLPAGLANFLIMCIRYSTRMNGFFVGLTEDYPPFTFDSAAEDPGDHSISLSVQPQLEGRSRLSVFFRIIMAIPLLIVGIVYAMIMTILMLLAWFAVLFTGSYPEGMRNFVIGSSRFFTRLTVYVFLLTDEYPPFDMS